MATYRDRKFEFFVVVVILGVLLAFLLNSLERVQREMEEASVQSEVSALRVELLDRLAHHETFGGPLPQGENPVIWTGRQPAGYVGELDKPPVGQGVWYYNTAEKALIYRSRYAGDLKFRLTREGGRQGAPAVLAGVGLMRLEKQQNVK